MIIKRKWFSQEKRKVGDSRKYNSPTICEKNTKVKPGIRELSSISRKEKNDPEASSWLGSLTKHFPSRKAPGDSTQQKGPTQQKETNETKMRSWFFSSKSSPSSNSIEKVDKTDKKGHKTSEVDLMRRMCGEFREVARAQNKEEREERQRELAKVRGARYEIRITFQIVMFSFKEITFKLSPTTPALQIQE